MPSTAEYSRGLARVSCPDALRVEMSSLLLSLIRSYTAYFDPCAPADVVCWRRLRRVRYERCTNALAVIGRPRSCQQSCWQLAMRMRTGCPETAASRRSGADADACTEYAPRARLSRHGRSPQSRSLHGRRNMLCLIKSAVAAREARRRRDSPAAAPAARFTLTFAPWCVGVAAFPRLHWRRFLVVCCMLSAAYHGY